MPEILDPATGRSFQQDRLLASLKAWSTDPQVLKALIDSGWATERSLVVCAHRIAATCAGEPKEWVLSPTELAVIGYQFVRDRNVRRVIAKRTWQLGRAELPPEATPAGILASLTQLSVDLNREYQLEAQAEAGALEMRAEAAGIMLP